MAKSASKDVRDQQPWKAALGLGAGGAIFGGIVWFFSHVPGFWTGGGFFERLGWPFNNGFLCLGAGALIGFFAGIVQARRRQTHSRLVAGLSGELGFT